MIRPLLIEIVLFAAPFALYAIYLSATGADPFRRSEWPLPRVIWLIIAGLVLMLGSFLVLGQFGGDPAGSSYVPAHIENGRFVPGQTK